MRRAHRPAGRCLRRRSGSGLAIPRGAGRAMRCTLSSTPRQRRCARWRPLPKGSPLALNTERAPTRRRSTDAAHVGRRSGECLVVIATELVERELARLEEAFADSRRQYGSPRSQVVVLGARDSRACSGSRPSGRFMIWNRRPTAAVCRRRRRRPSFEITETGEHAVVAERARGLHRAHRPDGNGYLLASARNGLVYRVGERRSAGSVFISRPLDAQCGGVGELYLRGDLADGRACASPSALATTATPNPTSGARGARNRPSGRTNRSRCPMARRASCQVPAAAAGVMATPRCASTPPNCSLMEPERRAAHRAPRGDAARPGGAGRIAGGAPHDRPAGATSPQGSSGSGSSGSNGSQPHRRPTASATPVPTRWSFASNGRRRIRTTISSNTRFYYRGEEDRRGKLVADELTQDADVDRRRRRGRRPLPLPPCRQRRPGQCSGCGAHRRTHLGPDHDRQHAAAHQAADARPSRAAAPRSASSPGRNLDPRALKIDIDNGDALPRFRSTACSTSASSRSNGRLDCFEPGEHVATVVATTGWGIRVSESRLPCRSVRLPMLNRDRPVDRTPAEAGLAARNMILRN